METSFSRQVVRSFLWQGSAQAIGQAVTWLATVFVVRLLAPADYGLMAMANVFMGFFLLFGDWVFGLAAIQAESIDRQQLSRMFGIVLVSNVSACLLTFASAPLVASYFGEPRVVPVIRVLSVNFLLLASYVLPQSQVWRDMNFRTKARIEMLGAGLSAMTALAMAAAGRGVWALVSSVMVMHTVKAVAYNAVRPLAVAPTLSSAAITRLARFGVLATVSSLLYFVYGQMDVIIGGRVLGKEAIGLYSVALSLAAIPMEKVLPVLNQVSFAAFSRIQSDRDRVRRNLLRGAQLVGLVCFPVFLGMAAVAGDMVPVVLGERWVQLIVPFQLLCLVLPLKAVAALFSPALFGIGRPGVNVGNMAVALGAMSVAIFVGVHYGVVGLCLAWVITYPGVFAVIAWRALRTLDTHVGEFLGRAAFPAVAGVVMALGVTGLRQVMGPHEASALRLCALVAWVILLYGGSILLFQRRTVRELLAVARG